MKLRLRATIISEQPKVDTSSINLIDGQMKTPEPSKVPPPPLKPEGRQSYLDTVLKTPPQGNTTALSYPSRCSPYLSYRPPTNDSSSLPDGLRNKAPEILPLPNGGIMAVPSPSMPGLLQNVSGVGAFCIDCNNCGKSVPNEHYHCSICDGGDYDLCQTCVDQGVSCDGDDHWLIKRCISNGAVIPSTTETIAPKASTNKPASPGNVQPTSDCQQNTAPERTCNSCIRGEQSPVCRVRRLMLPRTSRR